MDPYAWSIAPDGRVLAGSLATVAQALHPLPTPPVEHWPPPGPEGRAVDIWHHVPLVAQQTGMSCCAAAAAMIIGWRDRVPVDGAEVARGARRWEAYREGLEPRDTEELAKAWGLHVAPARSIGPRELEELLREHGPLWMGEADPELHVVVVVGMSGDGTRANTLVRCNDPWPVGRGERYSVTLDRLLQNFDAATAVGGSHIQVLHGGGRPADPATTPD